MWVLSRWHPWHDHSLALRPSSIEMQINAKIYKFINERKTQKLGIKFLLKQFRFSINNSSASCSRIYDSAAFHWDISPAPVTGADCDRMQGRATRMKEASQPEPLLLPSRCHQTPRLHFVFVVAHNVRMFSNSQQGHDTHQHRSSTSCFLRFCWCYAMMLVESTGWEYRIQMGALITPAHLHFPLTPWLCPGIALFPPGRHNMR